MERIFYVLTAALLFKVGWIVSAKESAAAWVALAAGVAAGLAITSMLKHRWVLPGVLLASLVAVAVGFVLEAPGFVRLLTGSIGLASGAVLSAVRRPPRSGDDDSVGRSDDPNARLRTTQRIVYFAFGVVLTVMLLAGLHVNSTYLFLVAVGVALAPFLTRKRRP